MKESRFKKIQVKSLCLKLFQNRAFYNPKK